MEKPLPEHETALVEDQLRVVLEPDAIEAGFAESDAVGAGAEAETVTVVVALAEPPEPVHETEYAVVCVGLTVVLPLVPDALKPLPEQLVALVELHESVEDCPFVSAVGLAVREAVGAGAAAETVTVALAVAPPQLTEYAVVCAGETPTEPDVPEAVKPVPVQEEAFVEFHERVEDWPLAMEVGLAARDAVGAGAVTAPVGPTVTPADESLFCQTVSWASTCEVDIEERRVLL